MYHHYWFMASIVASVGGTSANNQIWERIRWHVSSKWFWGCEWKGKCLILSYGHRPVIIGLLFILLYLRLWGYRGVSPTTVRPSDPALCGSRPLVTPY